MTTAEWIFEKAVYLMDEADGRTGRIDATQTADLRHRTLPILNILRIECGMVAGRGDMRRSRWNGTGAVGLIPDFETPLDLEDEVCQGVLPYGLAAHLMLEENPDKARFFQQRYEELLERYRMSRKAVVESLDLPYGGIGIG